MKKKEVVAIIFAIIIKPFGYVIFFTMLFILSSVIFRENVYNDSAQYDKIFDSKSIDFNEYDTCSYLFSIPNSPPKDISYFYFSRINRTDYKLIAIEANFDTDNLEIIKNNLRNVTYTYGTIINRPLRAIDSYKEYYIFTYLEKYDFQEKKIVEFICIDNTNNSILWCYCNTKFDNYQNLEFVKSDVDFICNYDVSYKFNISRKAKGGNKKVFLWYNGYSISAFKNGLDEYIPEKSEILVNMDLFVW